MPSMGTTQEALDRAFFDRMLAETARSWASQPRIIHDEVLVDSFTTWIDNFAWSDQRPLKKEKQEKPLTKCCY